MFVFAFSFCILIIVLNMSTGLSWSASVSYHEWWNMQTDRQIYPFIYELILCTDLKWKGKVVPVLNQFSTMPWRHMGEWRHSSTFLDRGTRWRWVVSFTALPFYSRGKSPRNPLDRRRLGGPQSRYRCCGQEKNLAQPGVELGPSSHKPVVIPTELFRLLIKSKPEN
jgi:hypothetical protein